MIPIIARGAYFPIDENGFIGNPTSWELIDPSYLPLVDDLVAAYRQHAGQRLMAVFLRGTVPRGLATSGYSDIDAVGILHCIENDPFIRWTTPEWAGIVAQELTVRYSLVLKFDLAIADHDPDLAGRNRAVKFVLKTQGLCVFGEDVTQSWPSPKIDRSIAFQYKWLLQDFETWHEHWSHQSDSFEKTAFLQSFCKMVLRSGFELVMEREGTYTVDLYPCFLSFCKYYPAHAAYMEAAFLTFLNPEAALDLQWMNVIVPFLVDLANQAFGEKLC